MKFIDFAGLASEPAAKSSSWGIAPIVPCFSAQRDSQEVGSGVQDEFVEYLYPGGAHTLAGDGKPALTALGKFLKPH